MGQARASNFSHGLGCVVEEESPRDNAAAAAEQRRQHILESMAKLEGHSPENIAQDHFKGPASLLSSTQSNVQPIYSMNFQAKDRPTSQQFEQLPCRQSFSSYVPSPPVFPCFYYHPVYPANFVPMSMPMPIPMPTQLLEMNSMTSNLSFTAGSSSSRPLSAPIRNQGIPSQELAAKYMQQEGLANTHHLHRRHTNQNEIIKTPEKSHRSRSTVISPESSPESLLPTPPPILKYHSSSHNQQRKKYSKLQFLDPCQDASINYDQDSISPKKKLNQIDRTQAVDQNSNESSSLATRRRNQFDQNLAARFNNNSYASQLQSKQTGVKLIDKKRLTFDEVKALQSLPPLPPRPESTRASLLSITKKKKKDPFAWFRY